MPSWRTKISDYYVGCLLYYFIQIIMLPLNSLSFAELSDGNTALTNQRLSTPIVEKTTTIYYRDLFILSKAPIKSLVQGAPRLE